MNGFFGYFIFRILPAIAALTYAIYLAYILSSPIRLKTKKDKIASKYKDAPNFREIHLRFYNKRTLVGWTLIAFFFVVGIPLDYYRAHKSMPTLAGTLLPIVLILILFAGLFLLPYFLKRKT